MIRIGYQDHEKLGVVADYRRAHPEIENVIVFSPQRFWLDDGGAGYEQYEWADIIMYKVFYPLLERIDSTYMVVVNECLRVRNRNVLTYNCLHHYLNQTPHRIVFEYFPFIEDSADFMILADKDFPGRFKGTGYDRHMLDDLDLEVRRHHFAAFKIEVLAPSDADQKYEEKKKALFDGLGNKDPDTIPRQLHIWCGQYKRAAINEQGLYVARNGRFGKDNVHVYKGISKPGDYTVIDFPHRRIEFNDFLKASGSESIEFLTTRLNVDEFYFDSFTEWIRRLEGFYVEASLHQSKRG